MNTRERLLIEALYDVQDKTRNNAAVTMFFYNVRRRDVNGKATTVKSQYAVMMENIVRKYFSGEKYRGSFREVYDTFATEFYKYLLTVSKEKFLATENFENYLFVSVSNFCRNTTHRKAMDVALGIEEDIFSPFSYYNDRAEEADNPSDCRPLVFLATEEKDSASRIKNPEQEDDGDSSSLWAEKLLNGYINQISNDYYRLVLNAVLIEGMEREDFAEEQGKKVTAVYNDVKRAIDALIKVALPDVKVRTRSLFFNNKEELSSKDQEILERFYYGETSEKEISDVLKSYSNLRKQANRVRLESEKELKSEAREQRRIEKEQEELKKEQRRLKNNNHKTRKQKRNENN